MFDLVLACFIGIGIGTCTGMVPGIHVNTAGAIMFASSAFLLNYISAEFLCVIFVAMSIAHALIEFVSAEFLCVIFVAMSIAHALIEFEYKLYTIFG